MDDQNPNNEQRPGVPAWVWILGLFAIILGVNFFFTNRAASASHIGLTEAMDHIRAGDVKQVSLTGSRLGLTMTDGTELSTTVD